MAKTAFLLFGVLLVVAGARYVGRLDDFIHMNEKRVGCQRGHVSKRSGVESPAYFVTSIPKGKRLAFNMNPSLKYRSLGFLPKRFAGLAPLPFNKPLCAGLAIDPAAIGGETQQIYVDTNWGLYIAEYGEESNRYKPVRLHYDPHAKSLFVPFTHRENEFRLCVVDVPTGVKLSPDCRSKYNDGATQYYLDIATVPYFP